MTLLIALAFWIVLLLSVAAAITARISERFFVFGLLAATLATWSIHILIGREGRVYADLAIDIPLLVFTMWFVFRSDRFWPIWFASFQLLVVTTEIARFVFPIKSGFVYGNAAEFWAFPALITFVAGVTLDSRIKGFSFKD